MTIVKTKGRYQVRANSGRNMGTYDSKLEAIERLKQVEMFSHMKKQK